MNSSMVNLQLEAAPRRLGAVGEVWSWLFAAALTSLVCLVAWRLSVVLDTGLVLCAAYATPAGLSLRSLSKAFASFCAVTAVGVMLLGEHSAGTRLAFVLVGICFASAVLYVTVVAGEKLAAARRGLGTLRRKSASSQAAVQRAGVCVVVVGRNQTWSQVNDAAWNAFGSDARLRRGMDSRVEMDDEAATALMHSGSRESWRKLHESVIADASRQSLTPGQALPPYRVSLYDVSGRKGWYRFTVTLGQEEEFIFVGFQEVSRDSELSSNVAPSKWFQAVVGSMSEPALVLQSDGAILASNPVFRALCGNPKADFVFDCPAVHGASERVFATTVWLPTKNGACDLPGMYLEGAGQAVAARLSPPQAAYTEAVIIVFKEQSRPVSDEFVEITKPMPL